MNIHLALPAELTIYCAAETRSAWLAILGATPPESGDTVVDGSAVAEVDAAGLQLLVALSRSVESRGRALILNDPSPALGAACRTLGLQRVLGDAAEGT